MEMRFRMSDTLFTAIRASLDTDPARMYSSLVLYTPFGVVRGKISRSTSDNLNLRSSEGVENNLSRVRLEPDVLELEDCYVEHYSNHLPTGYFRKLYIRIDDIHSFAFDAAEPF